MTQAVAPHNRIHWISTGGTIAGRGVVGKVAGYKAGDVSVAELLASEPLIQSMAVWSLEQPFSTGSQHLTQAHGSLLIDAVRQAVADPEVDAVLVTHGTDTLEETALLLHLLLPALNCMAGKPVVLTAAMRPATALSADGAGNIADAVSFINDLLKLNAPLTSQAVWVVMQGRAFAPIGFSKQETTVTDAFAGNTTHAFILDDQVMFQSLPSHGPWTPGLFESLTIGENAWPEVVLVHLHADMQTDRFEQWVSPVPDGLVLATLGHRSIPDHLREVLEDVLGAGCPVVRASRVGHGPVFDLPETLSHKTGAAGFLTPVQARLALQLCLTAGTAWPT